MWYNHTRHTHHLRTHQPVKINSSVRQSTLRDVRHGLDGGFLRIWHPNKDNETGVSILMKDVKKQIPSYIKIGVCTLPARHKGQEVFVLYV